MVTVPIFMMLWIAIRALILAYISTSELPRELKMVAKPIFLMIWIAIKVLRKLLVISLFGGHLGFQNGRHFQHISAYDFNF